MKKMKNIFLISLIASILLIGSVMAVTPSADNGLKHPGKASQLYLYEKDPANWTIVEDGAWGKMTLRDNRFAFNGHGLESKTNYTLIYYPDPWPGTGLMCLGSKLSAKGGNIHIAKNFDFTAIPIAGDTNLGAKIWLVLSSDVDCNASKMIAWNPTKYLFEYDLVNKPVLNLYEKDPANWTIVKGGASGKMAYDDKSFVFNGVRLNKKVMYTLIYYKDPWNGKTNSVNQCLASGKVNGAGKLSLAGDYDFTAIPEAGDANSGAKIWLVLSSDVSCPTGGMTAWNPTEYLFESNLI